MWRRSAVRLRLRADWGKGWVQTGSSCTMLLVTGGAGFIGSNVVACLNEAGRHDVAVSDWLGEGEKWRNLQKRQLADMVSPAGLDRWLENRKLDAVIHLGAISDTTVTDGDAVMENNFRLSLKLLDWCTDTRTPFIYASSAATYGDGEQGFSDDRSIAALKRFKPMNLTAGASICSILHSPSVSRASRKCRPSGRAASSSTCSAQTSTTRAR